MFQYIVAFVFVYFGIIIAFAEQINSLLEGVTLQQLGLFSLFLGISLFIFFLSHEVSK